MNPLLQVSVLSLLASLAAAGTQALSPTSSGPSGSSDLPTAPSGHVLAATSIVPAEGGELSVTLPEPPLPSHVRPVPGIVPQDAGIRELLGSALPPPFPPVRDARGMVLHEGGTRGVELPSVVPPSPPPVRDARDVLVGDAGVFMPFGDAVLHGSYVELAHRTLFLVHIEGAADRGFSLMGKMDVGPAFLLGSAPTDATGRGEVRFDGPPVATYAANSEMRVMALYRDEHGDLCSTQRFVFRMNPKPRTALDFDWAADGSALPAGSLISEQWSEGLKIWGEGSDAGLPDAAILFDSASPTGGDFDLATPGTGPMNDVALGQLLILPADVKDLDGDGLVDVPRASASGGKLVFEFGREVDLYGLTLIDVDDGDSVFLRLLDGGRLIEDFAVPELTGLLADNNAVHLGFASEPVTRLEIQLSGSMGVAALSFVPHLARVDFDSTMTGAPLGQVAGKIVGETLLPELGFRVRVDNGTSEALFLDSEHLAVLDDKELQTPGYHRTNTEARGLVVVVPENLIDANGDGIVDVPDSAASGGTLSFEFESRVTFESASVLDVDVREHSWVEFYRHEPSGSCTVYTLIEQLPLQRIGDNSLQTLSELVRGVDRIDFVFDGSAAVTDLVFRPEGH